MPPAAGPRHSGAGCGGRAARGANGITRAACGSSAMRAMSRAAAPSGSCRCWRQAPAPRRSRALVSCPGACPCRCSCQSSTSCFRQSADEVAPLGRQAFLQAPPRPRQKRFDRLNAHLHHGRGLDIGQALEIDKREGQPLTLRQTRRSAHPPASPPAPGRAAHPAWPAGPAVLAHPSSARGAWLPAAVDHRVGGDPHQPALQGRRPRAAGTGSSTASRRLPARYPPSPRPRPSSATPAGRRAGNGG